MNRLAAMALSLPWGKLMQLRRCLYQRGLLPSEAPGLPVLSVGNLSLGGTGKSPLTRLLAQSAIQGSNTPLSAFIPPLPTPVAILSRGYGRRSRGWVLVSKGEGPLAQLRVEDSGDEPLMLAQQVPQAWVAVCEDRREGARRLREMGAGSIILDDGYQHLALRRNGNILLWDSAVDPRREALLPFGHLRENFRAALAATVLVLGRPTPDSVRERVEDFQRLFANAGMELPPVLVARASISALIELGSWQPLHKLAGRHGVVCGIASPDRFLQATLRQLGTPAWSRFYGDHHAWTGADVDSLRQAVTSHQLKHLLCTWKDAVRMPADHGLPLVVADQELRIQPVRDYLQA